MLLQSLFDFFNKITRKFSKSQNLKSPFKSGSFTPILHFSFKVNPC